MRPEEFEELVYRVENGVARLQLNRPGTGNSFSSRLYGELKWAIRNADFDDDVDVVVITGVGRSFATGGDLKEVMSRIGKGDGGFDMYAFTDNLPWDALRLCAKPVIAAINGHCFAGGLITAAWCDIQVAVQSAEFALSEARVGMVDAMAPVVLHGRMPMPKLKYAYLTGKPFSARQAEEWGLITEVVPDGELGARVDEIIKEVRGTTPVAHAALKRFLHELIPQPWDSGGMAAFRSPELVEGLTAFAEKRDPNFRKRP
jgi:enoyl-CoA hydratase/carnithine racemase